MSVDLTTVKRVSRLARIALSDEDAHTMTHELNAILGFVEQLNAVDVEGVDPMTSIVPMTLRLRKDDITSAHNVDDIVENAPLSEQNFFSVPKVIE